MSLYAIRDGHSRRVPGYGKGPKQYPNSVVTALENARIFWVELPEQEVLHVDRRKQFTGYQLNEAAIATGLRKSMGKTEVCWDNAMVESFWATLSVESFYGHVFVTRAQVYDGVSGWIEAFNNRCRR